MYIYCVMVKSVLNAVMCVEAGFSQIQSQIWLAEGGPKCAILALLLKLPHGTKFSYHIAS